MKKALIYCRVSSGKQMRDGDSQEVQCREYAQSQRYSIEKVFRDGGVSGSIADRPEMKDLLNHLVINGGHQYVVIFDKIDRVARGIDVHVELMRGIRMTAGASIESSSMVFEETPAGKLVENLLACVAGFERDNNAERVKARMKACMQRGYYVVGGYPPRGYIRVKDEFGGKKCCSSRTCCKYYKRSIGRFFFWSISYENGCSKVFRKQRRVS